MRKADHISFLVKICVTVFAVIFVGACTFHPDGKPPAQMTFEHIKPFPLYVASYEIRDNHKNMDMSSKVKIKGELSEPEDNNGNADFAASVATTVNDYLNSRFSAVGNNGKFLVILREAYVSHYVLPAENKIGAMLNVGNQDRYEMKVVLDLSVFGVGKYEEKERVITASRIIDISEFVSLAERERLQMAALDRLIDDIDGKIQDILINDFAIMRDQ